MNNLAVLWDSEYQWEEDTGPYVEKRKNKDWEYYSEKAEEKDIAVYVGSFENFSEGILEKSWHWNGEKWERIEEVEIDGVFDKFRFDEDTVKLKKWISDNMLVLNNLELEELCKDKLKTYERFPDYVPETRRATPENARKMFERHEKIVLKPSYGFGGQGIEILESLEDYKQPKDGVYILQEFVATKGFPPLGINGPHDLRIVVVNGEMVKGNYVRVPREGMLSNISLGGSQVYISNEEIPDSIKEIVDKVSEELSEYSPSIFSVDFMLDDGLNPRVIELNSKPGIYFNHAQKDDELEKAKIDRVVDAWKALFE